MYDLSLTRQSLPNDKYLYLLGVSLSVFSSNWGFVIENIIGTDESKDWYSLIDKTGGSLRDDIKMTISKKADNAIEELFSEIVDMRNRIVHGFRITSKEGEQILATKEEKKGNQLYIDEQYLTIFINKNSKLSEMLERYRKEMRNKEESEI